MARVVFDSLARAFGGRIWQSDFRPIEKYARTRFMAVSAQRLRRQLFPLYSPARRIVHRARRQRRACRESDGTSGPEHLGTTVRRSKCKLGPSSLSRTTRYIKVENSVIP